MKLVTITIKAAFLDAPGVTADGIADSLIRDLSDGLYAEVAYTTERTERTVDHPDQDPEAETDEYGQWQETARELMDGDDCPACRDELDGEPVDLSTYNRMCAPCRTIARVNAEEDEAEEAGPHCDMVSDCREPVTHIDTRGFAYCTAHGLERRDSQPCRKLRAHEIRRLLRGEQVTKY